MKRLVRCTVVLAAVAILFVGVGRAGAETLLVNEFSGTFDEIGVPGDGSTFELLGGTITATSPDTLPETLTIDTVTVDLTGYDNLDGGTVVIVGDELKIWNLASGTSAVLSVSSATLTQVLNSPIGVGFMELELTLSSSDLKTYDGDKTINLSVVDSVITMNGLQVTTNGSNGTASLGSLSSASITAVPEPSTLLLGLFAALGLVGYCRGRCGGRIS